MRSHDGAQCARKAGRRAVTHKGETHSGAASSSRSSSIAFDSAVGAHLFEEIGPVVVQGELDSGLVELVEYIGLVVLRGSLIQVFLSL